MQVVSSMPRDSDLESLRLPPQSVEAEQSVLGGLLLGLIESLGAGYIEDLTGGFLGSHYQDIFAFLVLIGVLVFRPGMQFFPPALQLIPDMVGACSCMLDP